MNSEFDDLQEQILEDARKKYSEITIDHFMNPRNFGELDGHDGFSRVTGPCGDSISIWIKVVDDVISDITFKTDGCGTSIASASMITTLAKGKTLQEAQEIGKEDVLEALGGLPEDSEHCGQLASDTLKESIKNFVHSKK